MSGFLQAVYPQVREVIDFSPDYKQYLLIDPVLLLQSPCRLFSLRFRAVTFLSRGRSRKAARKENLELACAQEFGLRVQGERPLRRGCVAAQSVPSLPFHEVSSGQHETRRYVLSVIIKSFGSSSA